jgi:hypothetical protein
MPHGIEARSSSAGINVIAVSHKIALINLNISLSASEYLFDTAENQFI